MASAPGLGITREALRVHPMDNLPCTTEKASRLNAAQALPHVPPTAGVCVGRGGVQGL